VLKERDTCEYLAVKELAYLLRVNPATIYRGVERGAIPAVRLHEHGALRIPRSFLETRTGP
jgi:excisionase family DNA binding protein